MLINMFGIRIFDNKIISSDDLYWETMLKICGNIPAHSKGHAVPKDYINDMRKDSPFQHVELGVELYTTRTEPFGW